ncbi:MAG: spore coat protein U domain-containing protein [Terracidiphilus sp.]|jgi:spore coat protein U-like protein
MRRLTIGLLSLAICGVRLTAQGNCQISNTYSIFFPSYSSSTVQTTGLVQFTCSNNTAYTIGLSAGATAGATVIDRMLLRSSDQATLEYQLFSNASYTTNWGNSAGTNWLAGTGTGNQQNAAIYARIPGAEAFSATANGTNFTDTVTVTLTWGSNQISRTIQVTLQQVAPGCGIGANPLSFGSYVSAALNATSTIQIACTGGTLYNIGLNAGNGAGATVITREMTGPAGALLNCRMFSNSAHSTNWGNTVGADTVAGSGNNEIQTLSIYGEILPAQFVPMGSYTDTIIATLTY